MIEGDRHLAPQRYPIGLQLLHGSIALLFGLQVALALVLHQLQSMELGRLVLSAHRFGGGALLLLVLARLGVSPWLRAPPRPAGLPAWQGFAAHAAHGLMLAMLAAQSGLGMLVAWSRGDAVRLLGVVRVPEIVVLTPEQARYAGTAHGWLALGLLALIAVHVGAVVFNRRVRGVAVGQRMLPPIPAGRLTNRMPVAAQLMLACGAILALATAAGLNGASQYRAFKAAQAEFDETEVAVLEDLRAAQVAQLGVAVMRAEGRAVEAAEPAKDSAAELAALAARLKDPDAAAAARAAAAAAGRVAAGDGAASQAAAEQAQAAVDSQSARVLQGRLDLAATAARGHDLIVLALLPSVLIGALAAFLLSRSIMGALARMRRVVQAVERGEALDRVEVTGEGDFARLMRDIGAMQDAVEARQREAADAAMRGQAEAEALARDQHERELARERDERRAGVVGELAHSLAGLAQGDLASRLERPFEAGYEEIRIDFNAAVSALEDVVSEIAATAEQMGASSSDAARAAGELSSRTEREAASLKETSLALDSITRRVEESARGARGAAAAVSAARRESEGSGLVVADTIQAMGDIKASSDQIGTIIGVVEDIAFQTNLLALNAAVEAAHAGDQGRGFGIIATEVRALAQRSAAAAQEIKGLVSASRAKVALGSELVGRTGEALRRVVDKVSEIDALVDGIAAAAAEQADGLSSVNGAIGQIDGVVAENAAMVQEATANADEMWRTAQTLTRLVRRFAVRAEPAPAAIATARGGR